MRQLHRVAALLTAQHHFRWRNADGIHSCANRDCEETYWGQFSLLPPHQLFTWMLALGVAGLLQGCHPGVPYPPTPDYRTSGDSESASQVSVALRVVIGPTEEPQPRATIVAVVYDTEGNQTTTEVGTFSGTVSEQAPVGDELVRVTIDDGRANHAVRMLAHDGVVEVREVRADEPDGELLRTIPIPEGTRVRASDPALESDPQQ